LLKLLPELRVLPHPDAVSPGVYDVAVVQKPVDQRRFHDFVTEGLPPLLEALLLVSTVKHARSGDS
jgi:hypothetical protein